MSCPSSNDLPSCLSKNDKSEFAIVKGRLRAHYDYGPQSETVDKNHNAGSVKSSRPIPQTCNIYYFEMKILDGKDDVPIAIGLTTDSFNLKRMPGWDKLTIGYHGDDGKLFYQNQKGNTYGPTFGKGDVVGCGVYLGNNTVFFTKNGRSYGVATKHLPDQEWYPTIGLRGENTKVEVNFGGKQFMYPLSTYYGMFCCTLYPFKGKTSKYTQQHLITRIIFTECQTNSGATNNSYCVFPFYSRKKFQYKCIWDKNDDNGSWCSTNVDENGIHKTRSGNWGYCSPECPTAEKPNEGMKVSLL